MNRFSVAVLAVVVTSTVAGCGGIVKANRAGYTGQADPASPTVISISPSNGAVTGGTSVSITGTNFLAGALVFFGSAQAQRVTVSNATHIHAVTPPVAAAGAVDVTVRNPDNRSGWLASAFTYNGSSGGSAPPAISAISPNSGPAGTPVTITGTNFESAATVSFGTASAASVTFIDATELQATVPAIASGTYDVTVTNPDPASATLHSGFTVDTPGPAESLLSGCTVSSTNTPTCQIPAGWTLVRAEGFEAGLQGREVLAGATRIATGFAHAGSHAIVGDYTADGSVVAWIFNDGGGCPGGAPACGHGGGIGSFTNLYISYWDYVEPQALYGNSDYSIVDVINGFACGAEQDFSYDAQYFGPNASSRTTTMMAIGQGSEGDQAHCQPFYQYDAGKTIKINAGFWEQKEIFYHPNTPGSVATGADCNDGNGGRYCHGDGEAKLFLNGVLLNHEVNRNLNGTQPMADPAVLVGGVITSFSAGQGYRCVPFSACPGPHPGTGAPPPFKRYIDDIIILKK